MLKRKVFKKFSPEIQKSAFFFTLGQFLLTLRVNCIMVLNDRPKSLRSFTFFVFIVFIAFGHVMGSYEPIKAIFE